MPTRPAAQKKTAARKKFPAEIKDKARAHIHRKSFARHGYSRSKQAFRQCT
jgi:hypothetical protein